MSVRSITTGPPPRPPIVATMPVVASPDLWYQGHKSLSSRATIFFPKIRSAPAPLSSAPRVS